MPSAQLKFYFHTPLNLGLNFCFALHGREAQCELVVSRQCHPSAGHRRRGCVCTLGGALKEMMGDEWPWKGNLILLGLSIQPCWGEGVSLHYYGYISSDPEMEGVSERRRSHLLLLITSFWQVSLR